jgi:hypothetical protein
MNNVSGMITEKTDCPGNDEYYSNDVQQISHFGRFIE